jgi:hypothetical protein
MWFIVKPGEEWVVCVLTSIQPLYPPYCFLETKIRIYKTIMLSVACMIAKRSPYYEVIRNYKCLRKMFGKIFESMEDLVDEQFRAPHSVERTNLHRPPLTVKTVTSSCANNKCIQNLKRKPLRESRLEDRDENWRIILR